MKNETKKFLIIFVFGILVNVILLSICAGMVNDQSAEAERQRELVKDKYVLVGSNGLGCKHYTFNGEHLWKCPKGLGISEVERRVCGTGKSGNVCHTVYDPVLGGTE